MYSENMNRELGTKWFTFYTKVRPCFIVIAFLRTIIDFFMYMGVYFSSIWLLLSFAFSVTSVVLAVLVAFKSYYNPYPDFVRFMKKALIIDIITMAYNQGLNQALQSGASIGYAFISILLSLVLYYFIWYRLNVKYFVKRLIPITNVE